MLFMQLARSFNYCETSFGEIISCQVWILNLAIHSALIIYASKLLHNNAAAINNKIFSPFPLSPVKKSWFGSTLTTVQNPSSLIAPTEAKHYEGSPQKNSFGK